MAFVEFTVPYLRCRLTHRIRSERGASLVEYALLLSLIVAVCVAAVSQLGSRVSSSFGSLSTQL